MIYNKCNGWSGWSGWSVETLVLKLCFEIKCDRRNELSRSIKIICFCFYIIYIKNCFHLPFTKNMRSSSICNDIDVVFLSPHFSEYYRWEAGTEMIIRLDQSSQSWGWDYAWQLLPVTFQTISQKVSKKINFSVFKHLPLRIQDWCCY